MFRKTDMPRRFSESRTNSQSTTNDSSQGGFWAENKSDVDQVRGSVFFKWISSLVEHNRPLKETMMTHLINENAARLIEFLKRVFGAKEINRLTGANSRVLHVEMKVGDSIVMI